MQRIQRPAIRVIMVMEYHYSGEGTPKVPHAIVRLPQYNKSAIDFATPTETADPGIISARNGAGGRPCTIPILRRVRGINKCSRPGELHRPVVINNDKIVIHRGKRGCQRRTRQSEYR